MDTSSLSCNPAMADCPHNGKHVKTLLVLFSLCIPLSQVFKLHRGLFSAARNHQTSDKNIVYLDNMSRVHLAKKESSGCSYTGFVNMMIKKVVFIVSYTLKKKIINKKGFFTTMVLLLHFEFLQ